ncbi:MAG: metalloregulator ArsR/SmtB family transcription factor [Gemmatimonadota bacterium]
MGDRHLAPALLAQVAERFKALGEPVRLGLLDALRQGERTVGDLVDLTSQQQANVSRHLGVLHAVGLVTRRREGTFVYYRVANPDVFTMCDLVCGRLHREAQEMVKAAEPRA